MDAQNNDSKCIITVFTINLVKKKKVEFSEKKKKKICKDASKEIIGEMTGEYLRDKDSKKIIYLT